MQELTTTTSNQTAQIVLCDEPGCTDPAIATFFWEWGQTGNVCAKHQALYAQRQESLGRRCTFAPLQRAAEAPLVRSERVQLRAEIGTLEAEVVETKARGLELYNQNIELSRQVQSLKIRDTEAQAQLKDATGKLAAMERHIMQREAELAEAVQEVQRLKALIPREPPPARSGRGVRTQHVIEGSGEEKKSDETK